MIVSSPQRHERTQNIRGGFGIARRTEPVGALHAPEAASELRRASGCIILHIRFPGYERPFGASKLLAEIRGVV
jgi:hypothetical protein